MLSLRVYLVNGKHVNVELKVPKSKSAAELFELSKQFAHDIVKVGVWSNERGEDVLHPASQILYVRLVKDKAHVS